MKFSYPILKQLIPDLPPLNDIVEKITMHLFEVESAENEVLNLAILPNRYADAACYWGLAREIAAICRLPFKMPAPKKPKALVKKSVPVEIGIQNLCRRIMGAYVENIRIGPSPAWLVAALEASSIRSINNLVDITNYVMLETGEPLHAFDYEKIEGGRITVRQAHEGEEVETVDRKTVCLNPSTLVLADEKSALDIAGIKGGTRAEITNETKTIAVTAANFDSAVIYKTAKRIGLKTDAAERFGHNVHSALVERGLYRTLELIEGLCDGKIGMITDAYPKPAKQIAIACDVKKYAALIGETIPAQTFAAHLKALGFRVSGGKVTPPPERTDIETWQDVVEEVVRLEGVNNFPASAPIITLAPQEEEPLVHLIAETRMLLTRAGFTELYLPTCVEEGEVSLENPLNAREGFLRAALTPGLTTAARNNVRFRENTRCFEIGRVFRKKTNHEPEERVHIGLAVSGKNISAAEALREAKGTAEYLMREWGMPAHLPADALHIKTIGLEQKQIPCATVELGFGAVLQAERKEKKYEPLPKYPAITRDLSVLVPKNVRVSALMERMKQAASAITKTIDYLASYENKALGEDKQSITFRVVFHGADKTLKDEEAEQELSAIVGALKEHFHIEIR